MKRYLALALIGAAVLAVSTSLSSISAQTGIPVNADGSYVVANDDGAPIAAGAGDNIVYGDVSTGGQRGEILGDPNAVYSPMVPDTPGLDGGVPVMPGAGDGLIGGVPILRLSQPHRTPRRRPRRILPARKAPQRRTSRSMPPRRPTPPPLPLTRRRPAGSARNTRPGTTLRSPTKTSARRRRTRRWCKRSTPTTTGSPARS